MRIKVILSCIFLAWATMSFAQTNKQPVLIILKSGENIEAVHFGQLRCGKEVYGQNYILVRGKFLDSPTEIKDYKDIEKIVPVGFTDAPVASVGNQKGIFNITKKDGRSVSLKEAEFVMSCYAPGDRYNEIVVQVLNPLTDKVTEYAIAMKDIQSVIFK
jgi:hypothetical protein